MRVSCYSFIEMARFAELLMRPGGALPNLAKRGFVYFLVGPGSWGVTGDTIYVDAGLHIVA